MGRTHTIYVEHRLPTGDSKTSVYSDTLDVQTTAESKAKKDKKTAHKKTAQTKTSNILKPAIALGVASKINSFVGEYTGRSVRARNAGTAIAYAGIGALAFTNPVTAGIAVTTFTASRMINYQLDVRKTNFTARYLEDVSGGIYDNSRFKGGV